MEEEEEDVGGAGIEAPAADAAAPWAASLENNRVRITAECSSDEDVGKDEDDGTIGRNDEDKDREKAERDWASEKSVAGLRTA